MINAIEQVHTNNITYNLSFETQNNIIDSIENTLFKIENDSDVRVRTFLGFLKSQGLINGKLPELSDLHTPVSEISRLPKYYNNLGLAYDFCIESSQQVINSCGSASDIRSELHKLRNWMTNEFTPLFQFISHIEITQTLYKIRENTRDEAIKLSITSDLNRRNTILNNYYSIGHTFLRAS